MAKDEHWIEQKRNATKGMKEIWPEMKKAKARLAFLAAIHERHQALVYEAERHLVKVVVAKPSASAKAKSTHWIKKIKQMSPTGRRDLAARLEEIYENN